MDRLRPRERTVFSGFTKAELEKMEKLLKDSGEECLDQDFCKKLARNFNCSNGRAGKPAVKWMEVQSWFQDQPHDCPSKEDSSSNPLENLSLVPEVFPLNNGKESSRILEGASVAGEKVLDFSELEFEARSSKDGAWYDVDTFLTHRFVNSGETEVQVRFVGFGADEDEWVHVKRNVRVRSLPLEHSECQKVIVGDLVLCFQEKRDQARYYDAIVVEIQRRLHDIRGCRCLFLIRYVHDNTEERVRLKRLCCRPILEM